MLKKENESMQNLIMTKGVKKIYMPRDKKMLG